jgi:hypothetical protein
VIAIDKIAVTRILRVRQLVNMQGKEVNLEIGQRVSLISGHIGILKFFGIQSQVHGLILLPAESFITFNTFKLEI